MDLHDLQPFVDGHVRRVAERRVDDPHRTTSAARSLTRLTATASSLRFSSFANCLTSASSSSVTSASTSSAHRSHSAMSLSVGPFTFHRGWAGSGGFGDRLRVSVTSLNN
ncbi:MAG: hypothetical protein ACK56I_25335, partial [bacterium]